MTKKEWRIKNTEEDEFSLTRSGACFYFDIMTENNWYWNFYQKSHYIGGLFKAENKIVNPEEYEQNTPYEEVE